MEMAKKRAIHEEDFDSALNLKEEIQKLRQALLQKMSNDGFAIDSSGEIVLRQRITPGGNLMAAVQQQSAPPAAVVAPASTEHASPPTTSVLLSGGAGQADKAGASPTTRNESNPDLHFATTTNWEENASVGEIRSSSPAATVRAGNFSVDASQNALGQNSAAITMDRVGGEQSPKASQSVDTGLSAPPLRLAPAAVALAEDPAPSSKRGSSIDVKKQPAIAEKSTPPASPKKSPKQQRLAAPQDALDRPIKVKPAAFDIDAFDENSTPPGLAPSQNEKSGVIAAPKRPAAKQTKTAAEEEATSSSPSPAKAKKAAPVAQDERPIKVKAVQYDSIEFDETSTPPGLEPPRQVAVKGAAKRAPKAKPDDASPAAARSPVMKVAKKKVDDEEQVRSPAPAKGARAARGKAAEEKSAVKRHARSTVSTGNPFSDHRTSDFEIEELSGMDRTEFFDSIFLFGDNVVACLVGKQFAAREWALTEVAQVLSEAAVYVTKNDDAVDPVVVVHGVYAVITKGMLDTREKIVSLAIQAWQNMLGMRRNTCRVLMLLLTPFATFFRLLHRRKHHSRHGQQKHRSARARSPHQNRRSKPAHEGSCAVIPRNARQYL